MATALITGASAGIGLEFAWQLASARHNVVLVARDAERLNAIAQQIESVAGVSVEVIPADLSIRADLERVAQRLRDAQSPIGLLVNNAGYGIHEKFLDTDIEIQERSLAVMTQAVLVLAHAAAKTMVARGRGAILNVSSVAALTASGTYSAHKAWVRTFTEGLAVELHGTGVTATALCPGFVHTEFHDRAGMDMSSFPDFAWLQVDQVVAEALRDVRRGVVISTPSLRYQLASGALRVLPRAAVRRIQGKGLIGRSGSGR